MKPATDIGARLRDLKEASGLTLAELGARAGRTPGVVSEWTLDKGHPSSSALERLAASFQLPISVFEEGGPLPSTLLHRPQEASSGWFPPSSGSGSAEGLAAAEDDARLTPGFQVPGRMSPPVSDNYDALPSAKLWDMLTGAIKAEGRPELTKRLLEAYETAAARERRGGSGN